MKRNAGLVAKDMLDKVAKDPIFIERIITGDETCVYANDVETVQQTSEWLL